MNKRKNVPLLTDVELRKLGRDIPLPFRIEVEDTLDGTLREICCTRILRLLPGRRIVCAGNWSKRETVTKIFLDKSRGKRHFRREQRGAVAMAKAGMDTPPLLFTGLARSECSPVIAFEEISGAKDLSRAWTDTCNDAERTDLLCRASVHIALQHEAGLLQADPHTDNFLVQNGRIYSVDCGMIKTCHEGRPLTKKRSLANLALFFAQFGKEFDGIIRRAFDSYLAIRSWSKKGDCLDLLMKRLARSREKRLNYYLKKIFRTCTDFKAGKDWRAYHVCVREYANFLEEFLKDPDGVVSRGKILKDGNSSTVVMVKEGGRAFVIKRYNIKDHWHAVKRAILPSRARVSWRNAHMLVFSGIATPRPIAMMEKRFGPFCSTAYLVAEFVDGPDARRFFGSAKVSDPGNRLMARRMVSLLHDLYKRRIIHGDLKATNFIVTPGMIYVTDLDSMKVMRWGWRFSHMARREKERFMKNWYDLPEWKALFTDLIGE